MADKAIRKASRAQMVSLMMAAIERTSILYRFESFAFLATMVLAGEYNVLLNEDETCDLVPAGKS